MKALVLGATGLVGRSLLEVLERDGRYDSVVAAVRRPSDLARGKVREHVDAMTGDVTAPAVDHVYCALGTTMKKAGSKEAFLRVDKELPLAWARAAKASGAKAFALVSSVGASPSSSTFYLRVKGETEDALRDLGFDRLILARPSFLMGNREEHRLGEKLALPFARALSPLLMGSIAKYKPIEAHDVAQAMVHALNTRPPGVHVLEHGELIASRKA